jgi:hypothetical protein
MNSTKIASFGAKLVVAGLLFAGMAQSASAANRVLRIHNRSGEIIENMYVSNAGTTVWGPDQLGNDTLEANSYVDWNIDDGSGYCRFDFKFVLKDGTVETKYRYNVCTQSDLYVVSGS